MKVDDVDIAGILAAIIVFGLLLMAGAGMGIVLFVFYMIIKYKTIDPIFIGSEMSNIEIGSVMLIGALIVITFFIIEFKKGNIR